MEIPIKIASGCLVVCLYFPCVEMEVDPKFVQKFKGPRIAKTIWKGRNRVLGLTLSDFKTHQKCTVIKSIISIQEYTEQ